MSEGDVSDVLAELRALYGSEQLCTRGVVHVAHVARAMGDLLHPIRIEAGAPHSATDFFVLNLCRARADAILTSSENLRREPQLTMALQGPWAAALARYRRDVLGKTQAPVCALLTRSGDLPLDHALWNDGTRKYVLTTPTRAGALQHALGSRAQVVAIADLDARSACQTLQARGAALISVEAGPSVASALYEPPSRVNELLLTEWVTYDGVASLATALPDKARLFAGLSRRGECERTEHGQRFRFSRWSQPAS